MDRDIVLEHLENMLQNLEQDYETESVNLSEELSGSTQNKIKRKLENISKNIYKYEQDIAAHLQRKQIQSVESSINAMMTLLKSYEEQLESMLQAYAQTIAHWPVSVRADVHSIDEIIQELTRIAPSQSAYTALDEFIACLIHGASDPILTTALNNWGQQYQAGSNWLQLYDDIQSNQDTRLEDAQPAILITIARSDEASTQSQIEEKYYELNAWLIEDIETYKAQKTGYHALVLTGSSEAEPCLIEVLLQKITDLLTYFLSENNRICEHCLNEPQVHVFLPLELMHLGIDGWLLTSADSERPELLGQNHRVMVRCSNRYERTYTKNARWKKRWKLYQSQLKVSAKDAFILGNDEDIEELQDILDETVQDDHSKIVGLHVTKSPVETKDLVYEILDSGVSTQAEIKRQPASGINKHATQKALQQSPEPYIVALTNSKNGYDANQYTGTQPKSR